MCDRPVPAHDCRWREPPAEGGTRPRGKLACGMTLQEIEPVMDYPRCRFDSPSWVGDILVRAVEDLYMGAPRSMVDLGCGGGVLSAAALRRWPNVELTTVDIDTAARQEIEAMLASHVGAAHRHLVADVLNSSLSGQGLQGGVDLVLSNPPYRSVEWASGFACVLKEAGLPKPSTHLGEVPADLVFLARAMNLVRPGGALGLILPDLLISGARMRHYRSRLLASHGVRRVVQLPRRAFRNTDAQAFLAIIQRDGRPSRIRLDRVRADGTWLPCRWIEPDTGAERLDHAFHDRTLEVADPVSIGDLGVEVNRGRISKVEASRLGLKSFHTTNFPAAIGGSIGFDGKHGRLGGTNAAEGDLLIARVHRNIETKIGLVVAGERELTDCVYRLRGSVSTIERVREGLLSIAGQSQIAALVRGTGARHLSKRSLLSLVV